MNLEGKHITYTAAFGLICLAVYQITTNDYNAAMTTLAAVAAGLGIVWQQTGDAAKMKSHVSQLRAAMPGAHPLEVTPAPQPLPLKWKAILGAIMLALLAGSGAVGQYVKKPASTITTIDPATVLPATQTANLGEVCDITAKLPDGTPFAWGFAKQPGAEFRKEGLVGSIFPEASGTYFIYLSYGNPIQVAWCKVTVADKAQSDPPKKPDPPPAKPDPPVQPPVTPPTTPQPPPTIPPPTQPTATGPWLIVIEKDPTFSAWKQSFATNDKVVTAILKAGARVRLIDRTGQNDKGPVKDLAQFAEMARQNKLPAPWLFVVDPVTMEVRSSLPLPSERPETIVDLLGVGK